LMKISSKIAFENFKNFISFHETFKMKFSTHISSHNIPTLQTGQGRRDRHRQTDRPTDRQTDKSPIA